MLQRYSRHCHVCHVHKRLVTLLHVFVVFNCDNLHLDEITQQLIYQNYTYGIVYIYIYTLYIYIHIPYLPLDWYISLHLLGFDGKMQVNIPFPWMVWVYDSLYYI